MKNLDNKHSGYLHESNVMGSVEIEVAVSTEAAHRRTHVEACIIPMA